MRLFKQAALVIILAVFATIALARSEGLYNPSSNSVGDYQGIDSNKPASAPSYTGPGDIVSGATGWWGLRAYNAAYATGSNSAAIVCDTATFTTCSTINILSNGNFDTATASGSAACATACVVKSLTDQSGNGHNATCASASVCANLKFNCIGTLPCLEVPSPGSQVYTITGTAVTTGFTVSLVGARLAGAGGTAAWICCNSANPPLFGWGSATNSAAAYNGGSIDLFTASDNVVHALLGVFAGASSQGVVDGAVTALATVGTTGGNMTRIFNGNGSGVPGNDLMEYGYWAATTFSAAQYTGASSVSHNQCSYWNTPTSC